MNHSREQQRIVRTQRKRVEVSAGPGMGKTECIQSRAGYLISKGQDPSGILILSFSNAAVSNLKSRLSKIEGGDRIVVMTCHAYGNRLINKNLKLLRLKKSPRLLSDKDIRGLIFSAIELSANALNRKLNKANAGKARRLRARIDWLTEQQSSSGIEIFARAFTYATASRTAVADLSRRPEFSAFAGWESAVEAVHSRYANAKNQGHKIDYGDMVRLAIRVLKSKTAVTDVAFDHLLVDEYQDSSALQQQLFKFLARRIPSIMVVGDPYQAIFSFAGAAYTPLTDLLDGVHNLALTHSQRLTQEMANFVSMLLAANAGTCTTAIPAIVGRSEGRAPRLICANSVEDEAIKVARRVSRLLAGGAAPGDIAVLSRIGLNLRPVEARLRALNVLTQRQGHDQLADTPHVLSVLRLLKLVGDPEISVHTLEKAMEFQVEPLAMAKVIKHLKTAEKCSSLEGRYRACAKAYLYAQRGSMDHRAILMSVNAWLPLCRKYTTAPEMVKAVRNMAKSPAVVTSTIHQAKGREWKHVFVIGCTDRVLPDYRATTPENIVEERNLMFVAATRASETLTLSHAPQTLLVTPKTPKTTNRLSRFINHPSVLACLKISRNPAITSKG